MTITVVTPVVCVYSDCDLIYSVMRLNNFKCTFQKEKKNINILFFFFCVNKIHRVISDLRAESHTNQ